MNNFAVEHDKKPPTHRVRHKYPWADMGPGKCFRFTELNDAKRAKRITSCRVSGMRYFKKRGRRLTVMITQGQNGRVKVSVVPRAR